MSTYMSILFGPFVPPELCLQVVEFTTLIFIPPRGIRAGLAARMLNQWHRPGRNVDWRGRRRPGEQRLSFAVDL